MTKLIALAFASAVSAIAFAGAAHAAGPNPNTCGVGKQPGAYQDDVLKAIGMTWTCDTQKGTGGFNWKELGQSKPLQYQGCTIRWQGVGGTKSCKTVAMDYYPTTVKGKPGVVLVTNKGKLLTVDGFFGKSISKID